MNKGNMHSRFLNEYLQDREDSIKEEIEKDNELSDLTWAYFDDYWDFIIDEEISRDLPYGEEYDFDDWDYYKDYFS